MTETRPSSDPSFRRPFLDDDTALRLLFEGTARETGEGFFRALVRSLAEALGTTGAWVTEYDPTLRRLRALAFYLGGQFIPWELGIDGTPCARVVEEGRLILIPDRVLELYPGDPELSHVGMVSYMGVPLKNEDGTVIGHLAVLDVHPMSEEPRLLTVFQLFAERAAAELRRLRAQVALREREEKLARVLDGAMDAVVELDRRLVVTQVNAAAERVFHRPSAAMVGADFRAFVARDEVQRLEGFALELGSRSGGRASMWIPGGLRSVAADGVPFPAEATLSCHRRNGERYHTLILRDVNDRREAEQKIRSLSDEASYLREEVRALGNYDRILGESPAARDVLQEIEQVAGTDASVLILGETGTGKELVARAIHALSERREKALVRINCAAIPANLIESEFFGHEKGAFTGATARRDGRFALADKGTIFLDEIGELPPDLQVKLLRVLQEGEFEPVGSSRTQKVDVRVLSATNRDLVEMMKLGSFREDLYYRLCVFPLRVPPLRARGHDVLLLAEAFAERFATKMGRAVAPLTDDCKQRLLAYDWPGNVRELANVIERALITSRDGRMNLERAIPDASLRPAAPASSEPQRVRTAGELEALERRNILDALEAAGWKVSGPKGAAEALHLKPSTLSSRMKALGIRRPG